MARCRPVAVSILFWVLIGLSFSAGQEKPSGQVAGNSTYKIQSQLVQIFLTVLDGARRVTNLKLSNFSVVEDGKPQDIDRMDSEESALQIALLLDTSGSMVPLLKDTQDAAVLFVESMKPGDRVILIPFNSNITSFSQMTDDSGPIVNAIHSAKAAQATKLYDALLFAMKVLNDKTGRKAIVVFSDGEDTASTSSLNLVLNAASRSGYPIYAVCAGPAINMRSFKDILQQLADVNKGKLLLAVDPRSLRWAFLDVSTELRAAYVLSYYTKLPPDDRWHELVVNISESRYKVYSRRGFYLGKTAASSALARGMEKVLVQTVGPGVLKMNAAAALNEVASLPAETKPIDASAREEAAAVAPATQSKPATIKIDARLVEVPVYVESSDGKEPPNFLEKDFQVYEDSRRRDISFFSSISMEDVPKARDLALEKAGTGALQGKLSLAASEAQDLEFGRYYLVFDDLMADEGPFLRAKNATEEIMRKYASPLQPISVYFTSRGKAVNSGTTQIEALLDEVRKIGFQSNRSMAQRGGIDLPLAFTIEGGDTDASLTGELLIAERERLEYENRLGHVTGAGDQERNQPIIQRMLGTEVRDVILSHVNRLRRTLDGLGQAINLAAADPGKSSKTMIFISSGLYLGRGTQYDATNTLENLVTTAKRAGIRIFSLDTTVAAEEFMGRSAASGSMQLLKPNLNVNSTTFQSERVASLDTLVQGTGGKRLQSDNNISAAIQPAIAHGRLYYLAFVSRLPEDGRYHKINVTVSSRSVRVHARQGYYARPLAPPAAAPVPGAASEDLKSLAQRVEQFMHDSDFVNLAPALEELTRRFPDKSSLWYNLGLTYLNLKNPTGAVAAFQRAMALSPDDRATGLMLARAFAVTGNGDAAIETLQMLRRSHPSDLDLLTQLGRAFEAASQPAKAYDVYRSALDAAPSPPLDFYVLLLRTSTLLRRFPEALIFLRDYRERGGPESRIETWARQIEREPRRPQRPRR